MRSLAVAAILATTIGTASAQSSAGPECGSFALIGGEKGVNPLDHPPQGESPGDSRTGWRKLVDGAGEEIGEVHFVATVTATARAGRGNMLASKYFVKFPNGWVASDSLYELPDAADTSQRAGNATLVVTGGTEAFDGVKGKIVIEAGDPPTYVFDLVCE